MFEKRVNCLLSSQIVENSFVKEAMKATHETTSGNGSLKYSTSGDDFVDNFAAVSYFKSPRSYKEVSEDMQRLWSQDPLKCLKLAIYIRMITRKPQVLEHFGMEKAQVLEVQRGQGLRHEGILRMLWLAINHPATFTHNFCYFIAAGSWKDVITMLNLDLQFHGWEGRKLNWKFFKNVIYAGLANPNTTHLVRKYLPTIRTNSKSKTLEAQADTIIGRWIARNLFKEEDKVVAYRNYRKLKSEGVAHEWQQLISKQLYKEIKFDRIAGRALQLLVNSKFLQNHDLREDYLEWIKSRTTAKYTGFVFELFKPLDAVQYDWRTRGYKYKDIDEASKATINAQFAGLVQTSKEGVDTQSRFLVARDISGSMTSEAAGCGMSSYSVAKAMALYFSEFLTGPFANSFVEFADTCRMVQWKGETPVDKWMNDGNGDFGSTEFLSIAYLFSKLKAKGVAESDFPEGLLCISDGEFNYCRRSTTSFTKFRDILRRAGFSEEYVKNFKLVLWDIPNGYYGKQKPTFEDFADAPNCFHMSGYDPAAVSFILGTSPFEATPRTAEELFQAAMNQELLNKVVIPKDKPNKKKK